MGLAAGDWLHSSCAACIHQMFSCPDRLIFLWALNHPRLDALGCGCKYISLVSTSPSEEEIYVLT